MIVHDTQAQQLLGRERVDELRRDARRPRLRRGGRANRAFVTAVSAAAAWVGVLVTLGVLDATTRAL